MIRKTLNASRLQQEVDRRIHRLQEIVEDGVKIRVPRPQLQEPDKMGCDWNMAHFGNAVGFERDIDGVLKSVNRFAVGRPDLLDGMRKDVEGLLLFRAYDWKSNFT